MQPARSSRLFPRAAVRLTAALLATVLCLSAASARSLAADQRRTPATKGTPRDCTATQTKVYWDGDADHFYAEGASWICIDRNAETPANYAKIGGDCNDANAAINPAAAEVTGDGIDNDCDGTVDERPISLSTISIGGRAIDDGYVTSVTSDTAITVAVWVDTQDVLADTTVHVTAYAGGSRDVALQLCSSSPQISCPSTSGYIIIDTAATIYAAYDHQRLSYEVTANDGTTFVHRLYLFNAAYKSYNSTLTSPLSVNLLERFYDTLEEQLEGAIQDAIDGATDLADYVTFSGLNVQIQSSDTDVSGSNTGEGLLDGSISAKIFFSSIKVTAECFTLDLDYPSFLVNFSPKVPKVGGTTSEGGWPAWYANFTLDDFTAEWFDRSYSYPDVRYQAPKDWAAEQGELAFVVNKLNLMFNGYNVTTSGDYSPIDDYIELTGTGVCDWVSDTTEYQAEAMLGDISYYLYVNGLVTSLRQEYFGSELFEDLVWTIDELYGINLYEEIYEVLRSTYDKVWSKADDSDRGLDFDRAPALRNALEYVLNETFHAGLPVSGTDPEINLQYQLHLDETWTLGMVLGKTEFSDKSSGSDPLNVYFSSTLAKVGATDSSHRYETRFLQGDSVNGNQTEGPANALGSLSVGESFLNQLMYATTTMGLFNFDLGDGVSISAGVAPYFEVDEEGRVFMNIRNLTMTIEGDETLRAAVDANPELVIHQPSDSEMLEFSASLGFDAAHDVLLSTKVEVDLDDETVTVVDLNGNLPGEAIIRRNLDTALLYGVKELACLLPDHFVPVDVDDPASYCSADSSEVADTYYVYYLIEDALGDAQSDAALMLTGHYVATTMDEGMPQLDLALIKMEEPYMVVTKDSEPTSVELVTYSESFDLGTVIYHNFSTILDPSSVRWSSSNSSAVTVDANGLVNVVYLGGFQTVVISAAYDDATYGETIGASVAIMCTSMWGCY